MARAEGRSLVLRGQLVGHGDLHFDLRRPGSVDDLLISLRDDFAEDDPFCWWAGIEDRSRPAIDLDEVRAGSDFAADLVTLADELYSRLDSEETALAAARGRTLRGTAGALADPACGRAAPRLVGLTGVRPA